MDILSLHRKVNRNDNTSQQNGFIKIEAILNNKTLFPATKGAF